ncbi:hypothetical protein [Streptomyces sp. MMBL 11-1]|uniref:hypothetical protein n=1 Tax=Streptomyces sp. MMBL 11-1 TaxID=3026420 RepID=UPI00235E5CBB|nr:hypothetical protein [Streptomyces sp. MMBL 11-1]
MPRSATRRSLLCLSEAPTPAAELARRDGVRCVSPDQIPHLVDEIFDSSRIRPLVIVTTSHRNADLPLIQMSDLAKSLLGRADVALLSGPAAAWAMDARLPEKWRTFGGSVRIFFTDASEADPDQRHPLVYVSPGREAEAIRYITTKIHSVPSVWTRDSGGSPVVSAPNGQLAKENQKLVTQLNATKQELADARRDKRELQARVARLTSTGTDVLSALPPSVYDDAEKQLRYEIGQVWLWRYPEAERAAWPLRPYRLGPDWLACFADIRPAQRRDILDIVTDVLTGRAAEVAGRQVRPHRTRADGSAPQRVREDGATAWRCNIKSNSPAAPRMTWWKLRDGSLELGRISIHDDTRLR